MKRFLRHLPLLVALSFSLLVYFPGFMTNDSYLQWEEASNHNFSSDHPAIMSALWSLLLPLAPKDYPQLPMLVFHLLIFIAGLWLVFTSCFPTRKKSIPWAISFILLFPAVMGLMGNIWKDVGMVACWTLATGLILKAQYEFKTKLLWWALLPLFYGMSVRHNAPVAIFPFLIWMCWIWAKYAPKITLLKRSTGLLLSLFLIAMLFSKALTFGNNKHFLHKYTLFDLAGISVNSGQVVMPSYNQDISLEELKKVYSPKTNEPLFGSWGFRSLLGPANDQEQSETTKLWASSIISHPLAYLKHRIKVFAAVLGLTSWVQFPYHMMVSKNSQGVIPLNDKKLPGRNLAQAYVKGLAQSPLFRGWFYLAINLIFFFAFLRKRNHPFQKLYLALSSSSIIYILFLFPLVGAADFRYNIWSMVTVLVMSVHYFLSRKSPDPRIEIA